MPSRSVIPQQPCIVEHGDRMLRMQTLAEAKLKKLISKATKKLHDIHYCIVSEVRFIVMWSTNI